MNIQRKTLLSAGVAAVLFTAFSTTANAWPAPGEELYQARCARCHGDSGEGTSENFPHPLAGEKSAEELAQFIRKSMPSDNPGSLSEGDSREIAAFTFSEFYSPAAQARRTPPRRELSRLTARQHRNSIADLISSLLQSPRRTAGEGLEGHYATIEANGDGKQIFKRTDPQIQFDFGQSSPDPDKINPIEFAISWEGSVHAPRSGEYEFIVRSENAFRLYVNDMKRPLLDGWIKSGNQTEYRETLQLLGGRSYPLRLHFTKSGQGVRVDRSKEKVAPASIALLWRPPHANPTIIPAKCLSPLFVSPTLVLATPFPPDDRSTGFERGTSISAEWEQATTSAAIETAEHVRERLPEFLSRQEPQPDTPAGLRLFCRRLAERAFRRPLGHAELQVYVERPFERAPDPESAVERIVLMVLKSPRFLYPEADRQQSDGFSVASRLALSLWDSLPDDELLAAAAAGQLSTREQVLAQARRMSGDPRFDTAIREFFAHWLRVDQARPLAKDDTLFAGFDAAVIADLRSSLETHVDAALADERADFRQLLLGNTIYLNGRLAKQLGVDLPADAPFQKVELPREQSAGILTHPYLMAALADSTTSSPIRRGVFVVRSVLGRTLRPPPDAVPPLAPSLHPELTTRERAALQTSAQTCQSCHALINPLGFALEGFDAIGRVRTTDNQRAIDATGSYVTRRGDTVPFVGARQLAEFLASSDEVHTAFVEKLFFHAVKQPVRAYGPRTLTDLRETFVRNEFNIRRLMEEIAVAAALSEPDRTLSSKEADRK